VATVRVTDIIRRVEDVLQDTNVRWPRLELQNWINEAYLAVVLLRPDANSKAGAFSCAAGTRQNVTTTFPTALRLLDVTRNLSTGSAKKVIRFVARPVLDDQLPAWHAETETLNIQYYTFDARQPKEFFVYPPAQAGAEVEVVYTAAPGAHALSEADLDPDTGSAETIKLDDTYMTPIIDWVLYRAYSKDAEYGANEARAAASYQTFNAAIGGKTQSDSAANPKALSEVT